MNFVLSFLGFSLNSIYVLMLGLNFLFRNYQQRIKKTNFKLKKMYLIWVCKSANEFSWALNTIREVEKEVSDLQNIMVFVAAFNLCPYS